jgi:hypothetical protein
MYVEKEVLAPRLLSVRRKTLSNDVNTDETKMGDDDEEDPMVTHLEQDETEPETQRMSVDIYCVFLLLFVFFSSY